MGSRKAISPIIAIIIILLITIAIAGAAYSYLSVYWESTTGENLAVVDAYTTDDEANLMIKNTGTQPMAVDDIKVLDSEGQEVNGTWTTPNGSPITQLEPGKLARFNTTCTGYCEYRISSGGGISMPIPVGTGPGGPTGPVCGDGTCNAGEDCFSCPADCGICVSACTILNEEGKIYTQTTDITISGDNVKCINIIAENITFNGNGYEIATYVGGNQKGVYSNQYNTTIKNCNMNIADASGTGIELDNANNSYIHNNTLEGGIGVGATGNDIRIEKNNLIDIENEGIKVVGNNNIILDNILSTTVNGYYGINLQGSNNNLTNNTIGGFLGDWGIYILGSNNNVTDSSVYENWGGIKIRGSNNNVIDTRISDNGGNDVDSDSTTNIFLNCTYDISKETGSLIRKWYYRAYVNDTNGNNIDNANVTAYNSSGDYHFNLTTGLDGFTPRTEIVYYINNNGFRDYYSPYTIYADNVTHSNSHTYDAQQNNLKDIFTLT